MSYDGTGVTTAVDNGLGNVTQFKTNHPDSLNRAGKRSVLAVLTIGSTTVTSITVEGSGAPGGWVVGPTHTAQGRTLSLFSKICVVGEPFRYDITMSAPIPAGPTNRVAAWMADFATDGDPIRASTFADGAGGGSTLTFSSLTAVNAEDIWAFVWDNPDNVNFGQLHAVSPLTWTGTAAAAGDASYMEDATESWQSSSATGTRSFAVDPGDSYEAAIGVMVLVGGVCTPPVNDNWANATNLGTAASGTAAGTTVCASAESGEPIDPFWQAIPQRSVWYRWTAPSTGRFTFDSGPPDSTQTALGVFIGDSLATLTSIAYNDGAVLDQSPEYFPGWCRVIIGARVGMTYYIRLSTRFGTEQPHTLHWHPTPTRAVVPFDSPPVPIRAYCTEYNDASEERLVVIELGPTDPDWRVVGLMEFDGEILYGSPPYAINAPFDSDHRHVGYWQGGGISGDGKAFWGGSSEPHVYPDPEDLSRISPAVLFDSADGMGVPGMPDDFASLIFTATNRISYTIITVVDGQNEYWVVDRDATTGAVIGSKKIDVPSPQTSNVFTMGISSEAVVFHGVRAGTTNLLTTADRWEVSGSVGTWTAVSGIASLVRWASGQLRIRLTPGATTAVFDLPAGYAVSTYHSALGRLGMWATTGITGTASIQMLGPSGPIGTASAPTTFGNNLTKVSTVEAAVNGLANVGMRVTVQMDAPAGSFTDVFSLTGGFSPYPSLSLRAPVTLNRMDRSTGTVTTLLSNVGDTYPHWGNPSLSVAQIRFRPNGQLAINTAVGASSGGFEQFFSVLTADGSSIVNEYHQPGQDRNLHFASYDPNLDGWIVSYYGEPGDPYAGVDNAFVKAGMGFIDAATCTQHELPPVPQAVYDTWELDVIAAGAAAAGRNEASIGRSHVRVVRISNLPKGS